MARYIIPGFRKIETSGGGGEGGTTNYNDLTNKPFINNVPLVGNLNTVNLKLTDATLTEEGVPAEAKTVGSKLNELEGKYAKKDLYDDTTINVGRKAGTEIGSNSTSEGNSTTASGYCSHAEGYSTTASGVYSHAEGYMTTAEANSHAEGFTTTASGGCSHAEGDRTTASGDYSHAEGQGTNASSYLQHVQGKYNIEDTESKYVHIVGNGTSETERSNAHTVDWEGNAWYSGDVCNGNGVSLDGLQKDIEDLNSNLGNIFNLNKAVPLETDMNNLVNSKNAHILKMARYKDDSCLNTPLTQGLDGAGEGIVFSLCNSRLYATQICSPVCSYHLYIRVFTAGTIDKWRLLI